MFILSLKASFHSRLLFLCFFVILFSVSAFSQPVTLRYLLAYPDSVPTPAVGAMFFITEIKRTADEVEVGRSHQTASVGNYGLINVVVDCDTAFHYAIQFQVILSDGTLSIYSGWTTGYAGQTFCGGVIDGSNEYRYIYGSPLLNKDINGGPTSSCPSSSIGNR